MTIEADDPELAALGWSSFFAGQSAHNDFPLTRPYRVATRQRDLFQLLGADKPIWATVRGRLFESGDLPAVGDWVLARDEGEGTTVIEHVLERRSSLVRQAAGKKTASQVIAANLDVVFVVCSANDELNPRRIERYLTAVWDGGAKPVVVVNKADLSDRQTILDALDELVHIVPIALTSATGGDVDEVRAHLSSSPPTTTAFVGSSGVGKSTLVNALFGEEIQATGDIRAADDKGRHTTTARELIVSKSAGLLIDTPGMRELALWDGDAGVTVTFSDIEELGAECRFRDCLHQKEPGCAVKRAVDDGSISADRLQSYHKLRREIAHHGRDKSAAERHKQRLAGKRFGKLVKEAKRIKGR